jgi:hypothetical protein
VIRYNASPAGTDAVGATPTSSNTLRISSLQAGSGNDLGDVSLRAGHILDNGDAHIDVLARNLRLQAAVGIGNGTGGVNALDTQVVTLSARAAAGGIFINELDALTLDAVGPLTVNRVLADGTVTNSLRTDAAQTQVAVTGAGSIVVEAGSILAMPDTGAQSVAVSAALGAGHVRLQARGDNGTSGDLDVRGLVRGGSGNVSLIAAQDVLLAGLANIVNTTANTSIEVQAGRDISMAASATVTSVSNDGGGNARFDAGRDIALATVSVGTGRVALLADLSLLIEAYRSGLEKSG